MTRGGMLHHRRRQSAALRANRPEVRNLPPASTSYSQVIPHPPARKALKWSAAMAAILLAIAWLASARWMVVYQSPRGHNASLIQGQWLIGKVDRRPGLLTDHDFYVGSARNSFAPRFGWWFYWSKGPMHWMLGIPGWLPTLLIAALAALLWRRDHIITRRAAFPHICPHCLYDRTGIAPHAKCPECGSAPA